MTNQPSIVTLAETIVKLQAERAKAKARIAVVEAEHDKLTETLAACDTAQAEAQREMDKLAAKP